MNLDQKNYSTIVFEDDNFETLNQKSIDWLKKNSNQITVISSNMLSYSAETYMAYRFIIYILYSKITL